MYLVLQRSVTHLISQKPLIFSKSPDALTTARKSHGNVGMMHCMLRTFLTCLGVEAVGGGVQQMGSRAPGKYMVPQGVPLQIHTVHQHVLCRPRPLCTHMSSMSAQ